MKPKITILMTCAGGDLAPEYFKAFRESERYDIRTIAVDLNSKAIGKHFSDHFEVVPKGSDQDYIERMLEIVLDHNVELIFPGSDPEAINLSSNRNRFIEIGCEIASPNIHVLENLNDKAKTYQKLKEAGINHAMWYPVTSTEELFQSIKVIYNEFGECVVKPALSRGGRDVFVLRSDLKEEQHFHDGREKHMPLDTFIEQYQNATTDLFPLIAMQRLYEPTYDIDILSWQGEAKQVVPRMRHNPTGIPFIGNTIKVDEELIALGHEIAKTFELSWLLDIDVMSTKEGQPVVLEVNPRMSGSCPAAIKAGFPLFDNVIALSRKEKVTSFSLKKDTEILGYKSVVRVN